jgi:hypothetical protein
MATIKISQLPSVASITDATIFPVVNSGTTKQITANVIASYISAAGVSGSNLSIDGGSPTTIFTTTDIVFDGGTP